MRDIELQRRAVSKLMKDSRKISRRTEVFQESIINDGNNE